jgi:hypothetical protein
MPHGARSGKACQDGGPERATWIFTQTGGADHSGRDPAPNGGSYGGKACQDGGPERATWIFTQTGGADHSGRRFSPDVLGSFAHRVEGLSDKGFWSSVVGMPQGRIPAAGQWAVVKPSGPAFNWVAHPGRNAEPGR